MFGRSITPKQLSVALLQLLNRYEQLGKKPPSLSKLQTALADSGYDSFDEFLQKLSPAKNSGRGSSKPKVPAVEPTERIDYYVRRLNSSIQNPSEIFPLIEEIRKETKTRKSGTLNKAALERLHEIIVGAKMKFSTIDQGCDTLRQRIVERSNERKSTENTRTVRAF
jgi:hypothetical protein